METADLLDCDGLVETRGKCCQAAGPVRTLKSWTDWVRLSSGDESGNQGAVCFL